MKAIGSMIRLMDSESILTQMVQRMKVIGLEIYNMGKESRNGQMDHLSMALTLMGRRMEWEVMNGQTGQAIKESGKTMKLLVMVSTGGMMEDSM